MGISLVKLLVNVQVKCWDFCSSFFNKLYFLVFIKVSITSLLWNHHNQIIIAVRDGRGLMIWLFVGPTGVYLLDFFCSGIQFNLLLSPYPCFISLLYLDLYVLGDDALIS